MDTGGTFTDCFARRSDGTDARAKVLSSGRLALPVAELSADGRRVRCACPLPGDGRALPGFTVQLQGADSCGAGGAGGNRVTAVAGGWLELCHPLPAGGGQPVAVELFTGEPAPVIGARLLTGTAPGATFPPLTFRLATTRATNALLERKGAPTTLFITAGFADLPVIRDQRRPDLFALYHRQAGPLHAAVVEVDGRMSADGTVVAEPDWQALEESARERVEAGDRCAAISLLHAHVDAGWELRLADICRRAGFAHVATGAQLAPLIGLLARTETAVVEACLGPVLQDFVSDVAAPLALSGPRAFHLMTSAGGLQPRERYRAIDSLLSGPAAGVVGAIASARQLGIDRVITFDMGGTSTDVARCDGRPPWQFQQQVGDARLMNPSVRIETVAAGGGSICQWKPGGLAVGPESAGADPGPACYGRGGPLTVTDVNLLLGRLQPERTPVPLYADAAGRRLDELLDEAEQRQGQRPARREFLEGLLELAIETMAAAIRKVSVREGADPRDYALLAFGGAGPQHACAIADKLGIDTILAPDDAGLLSAIGLDAAGLERFAQRGVLQPMKAAEGHVSGWVEELERQALGELRRDLGSGDQSRNDPSGDVPDGGGGPPPQPAISRLAELRLAGQDTALQVNFTDPSELAACFTAEYRRLYGYQPPEDRAVELVSLRVVAGTAGREAGAIDARAEPAARHQAGADDEPLTLTGPYSTLVVGPGWRASQLEGFGWRLDRVSRPQGGRSSDGEVSTDAVTVELFRHRFAAVVGEMGALLQRTAISTNIKERLDFSCALLSGEGELLVNAPHIPVHLGALGECVRRCAAELGARPGETWITNHPAFGGSHLPDVTLITPVFEQSGGQDGSPSLLGYVANRAHHAEIGGSRPGSMPPDAASLAEEGVVFEPMVLARDGRPDWSMVRQRLAAGNRPSRQPDDNLADLAAQFAANRSGALALQQLASVHGRAQLAACAGAILTQGGEALRQAVATLPDGPMQAVESLDDGTLIRVGIERRGGDLQVRIESPVRRHPGNLNATPAIVRSALLYALRLLLQTDLPLNEGILRPVRLSLPESFLNPAFESDPVRCPAVVGGNVETSQRLVDTLLKAMRLQACSQGTMNNLLFGDDTFGYYETIGGGAGAGPDGTGAGGLHTHMTNTAITDPEVLEHRYPVRLWRFALRRGSGGAGRNRGGDGLVRELEFLRPLSVSLLTQHREVAPYGFDGGADGQPGRQQIHRHDGGIEPLPFACSLEAGEGDRLLIETPGGGGWGRPDSC